MRAKKQASTAPATLGLSVSGRSSMVEDTDGALVRAAECAVHLNHDLNTFMQAAHSAYMQASPATRERLEAVQLMAHLDDLRRRGVLATA